MRRAAGAVVGLFVSCFFIAAGSAADEKDDAKREQEMEEYLKDADARQAKTEYGIAMRKAIAEVVRIVGKAERIEVFRIEPRELTEDQRGKKPAIRHHEILKQTTVEKGQARKEIADFLGQTLHWNHFRLGLCYEPRHAVRAASDGHTVELLICFSCWRAVATMDGKSFGTFPLLKSDGGPIRRLVDR
ncbi:MAG TPA: hypothetical protein VHR72_09430 [Gemmataceae bacterium]|jgi:hypothetical protein|nr:hypothetical protein [Gemmataceae bacterium]